VAFVENAARNARTICHLENNIQPRQGSDAQSRTGRKRLATLSLQARIPRFKSPGKKESAGWER